MLDSFEILTTSGVVLWSKSYSSVKAGLINNFIQDVFIEEKVLPAGGGQVDGLAGQNPSYKKNQYTLRWTSVKDLGLIFVAVYQSLLHFTWIDKLLDNLRVIFVDLYGDQLRKPHTSVVECDTFVQYFEQQLKELEGTSPGIEQQPTPQILVNDTEALSRDPIPTETTDGDTGHDRQVHNTLLRDIGSPNDSSPNNSRPSTPASQVLSAGATAHPKGTSRRAKKQAAAANINPASSGDERSKHKAKKEKDATKKLGRRWDDSGMATEDDGINLDYSAQSNGSDAPIAQPLSSAIDASTVLDAGTRTNKGQYILKDLDSEVHSILQNASERQQAVVAQEAQAATGGIVGTISGLFKNVVGGKVLSASDLDKPIKGMEEHLLKKNVAREAAVRLCDSVRQDLVGVKTGSFESIDTPLRRSLSSSLSHLLTPTTSLDLLRSISSSSKPRPRPYVISVVGVNGVGKSTSLSKLAFFLLQNHHSLLIAACDTFRSGAVEQLRVHASNLSSLSQREGLPAVELYERGYGKDAANIAKDAVEYAHKKGIEVVLIDTAGRRHNDARLMGSLEKFAMLAVPDKIFMVGEALVGTDSVAQARSFNQAFGRRKVDGFIISKCDTVGDMVGTLVSMVHATGIPVVFLGVGQHYGDLRTLNVDWAVRMLMS